MRDWKVVAYQPKDCGSGLWYVKSCEVPGIVGMCEATLEELIATVKRLLPKLLEANGRPDEEPQAVEFDIAA